MSDSRDVVVRIENVSKKFRKGEMYDSLRDLIPALARWLVRSARVPLGASEFWALRDVSFEVRRGEAFGIIGPNGAGKSTILKLLCGIMKPTVGTVSVRGSVSALIEVGAGFHPDLTGRENILLNGTILGMSQQEIRRKFDEIVAFAELEEFIDTPVKRYSTGMYARLGFAVAAHVEPDLLIVDEVLSVGDYLFQRKCMERMKAVVAGGATVLFVSHKLRAISELCPRSLLLDHGRVVMIGSTDEVIRRYFDHPSVGRGDDHGKDVYLSRVSIQGADGRTASFESGSKAWVDLEVTACRTAQRVAVVMQITGENDVDAFNTSNARLGADMVSLKAGQKLHCQFELALHLAPGAYTVAVSVRRYDIGLLYDRWAAATTFVIHSRVDVGGIANLHPAVVQQWVEDAPDPATTPLG